MSKLKTLTEHNSQRHKFHASWQSIEPIPNGIACPGCGKELVDITPNITLTSNPPQKNTKCLNCGYVGYRIA